MYINRSQIVLTVCVLLMLLVAVVSAQERKSDAAFTVPMLQYQGRLTDPTTGEPLADGSYTMVFRLYAIANGGTPLWTETKDVPVQGSLFSTVLGSITPLDMGLFNGQALWLGIKVGTDEETVPRQQVMPVAYALSLVPGAVIEAESSSAALSVSNAGYGPAMQIGGPVVVEGNLEVDGSLVGGVHDHSGKDISSGQVAEARISGAIARDGEVTSAVSNHAANANAHHTRYTDEEAANAALNDPNIVNSYWMGLHTADSSAHHARYSNSEAVNAVKAADGSGSGLDADLLDGQHAGDFASSGHSHGMLPIAYGLISPSSTFYGTGNVSSTWTGSSYEIAVANNSCSLTTCFTIVTPNTNHNATVTSAGSGKIRVTLYDIATGNTVGAGFYFVIYK